MNNIFVILLAASFFQIGCSHFESRSLKEILEYDLDKIGTSKDCKNSMKLFIKRLHSVRSEDNWAFKMLDATSKLPQTLISYNVDDLGNFQECIEIESRNDKIMGKYCLGDLILKDKNASIGFEKDLYLKYSITHIEGQNRAIAHSRWAICLPANCTDEDALQQIKYAQVPGIDVYSVTCQTYEDVYPKLSRGAVFAVYVFAILGFIVILATLDDIYCNNQKQTKGCIQLVVTAFSAYTNGKKLFELPKYPSEVSCVDGLKVLSMVWIVLLHACKVLMERPSYNHKEITAMKNSIYIGIIDYGNLACDTFFVIGGTLVTYIHFKKHKSDDITVLWILKHYFHRYIRLAPSLAGLVLFSATLLKYTNSGPNWPEGMADLLGHCEENWWSTLLFIQNELDHTKMCVMQTWYLHVDMQLYIFSPLIFWILKKYEKKGIAILLLTCAGSIVLCLFKLLQDDLLIIIERSHRSHINENTYYKTETRLVPWFMGTILGYILTRNNIGYIRLPKKINILLWILSLTVMIICVFGNHYSLKSPEYARIQSIIYLTLFRPIFALAVWWVIWACQTNHGGFINTILSLPIFRLMNKFTYNIFLFNLSIAFVVAFSAKAPVYVDLYLMAFWFWGLYVLSFILSIIWTLVFEIPMINLEKIIFPPKIKSK
ncbi:unnamed protein product [Psylliodes chrysocephalus]|uniref:Nose resistant-to-fluoxetine protein N-terminal domain-containing protein n=1 Tax=Psylliodes chrysocephalus TaxID=3402493 RepID=A0A9P0CIT3_9CUCU|nr:unnamed protein product [Psylliodes chrysocephala]